MRKPKRQVYSKGELNLMIDSILHPLATGDSAVAILLLDGLLHSAVEQDPGQSIQKFIRYSLPLIVKNNHDKPKRARRNSLMIHGGEKR
ncbi:MAG: hypothetical protein ABSF36_03400 [Candidatus Methanomethylicaceae archaeon]|jgi:hypothetical protein